MTILNKNFNIIPSQNQLAEVQSTDAPNGKEANLVTVKMISEIARRESSNPLIRQTAINILNKSKTKSHQYLDEARAIAKWVKDNIVYVKDAKGVEQLHSPMMYLKQLKEGQIPRGDCDDMSLLLCTLLLSIGHSPKVKCVRYKSVNNDDPYNHIYVIEKAKNYPGKEQFIIMDCIMKDKPIGYQVKYASSDIYDI